MQQLPNLSQASPIYWSVRCVLAIIEPLAKILPATSNASVADVDAPILNPLVFMLLKGMSLILNSTAVTPLKPVIPVDVLYANKFAPSKVLFISS